jgi:serine/threonine protein phosphatase 1
MKANLVGRDFVMGDLHGHWDLLQTSLKDLHFDKSVDRLFSTGDLIDRGPESAKCLDLIYENWFFSVRGNHEDMMIKALLNRDEAMATCWYMNGGMWSFEEDPALLEAVARDAASKMPLYLQVGDFGIVHAEPPKDWEQVGVQAEETTLWGRDILSAGVGFEIENISKVYVGHTPVKTPRQLGNIMFIDTGAFHTGKLTILEIPHE